MPTLATKNMVERSDVLNGSGGLRIGNKVHFFTRGVHHEEVADPRYHWLVALVAVVKKTNVCSYASTLASSVSADVKSQVPTKFELERIRHEIAALDGDISQMVRPIAEYKVAIDKMRRDIAKSEKNIAAQKKTLLEAVRDVEAKVPFVVNGRTCTPEQVQRQIVTDTERLKQLEKHVKVQTQVLEAKELSLRATQDQLAKVISKKREYEVRLAQLEAQEETLSVAKIGSDVKIDNTRATMIEDALNAVEHRQNVEREIADTKNGDLTTIPLDRAERTPVDLQTIRNYLEGNAATDKTASTK